MSEHTLLFPVQLVPEVGLNVKEIQSLKASGCRFWGKKTCVAWIREHLDYVTAKEFDAGRGAHLQHSGANKSGALIAKSGSRVASLRTH